MADQFPGKGLPIGSREGRAGYRETTESVPAREYRRRMGVDGESIPTRRSQPERDLQEATASWRDEQIALGRLRKGTLVHIPNQRRDKMEAIRMWRAGAVAGVPDWLCLLSVEALLHLGPDEFTKHRFGCCAFIELKAPKGSLSKDQREFRDLCLELGIPYSIARSLEEFQQIVSDYGMLKEGTK